MRYVIDQCYIILYIIYVSTDPICVNRKSSSWHTTLRIRKKSERKEEGKKEGKLENGYRKSRDGLSNKVSVKVSYYQSFCPMTIDHQPLPVMTRCVCGSERVGQAKWNFTILLTPIRELSGANVTALLVNNQWEPAMPPPRPIISDLRKVFFFDI